MPATHMNRRARRWPLRVAAAAAALPSVVVLGAYVPALPVLGLLGAALSPFAGWLAAVEAASAAVAVRLLVERRSTWRWVSVVGTTAAFAGAAAMTAQIVAVGAGNGAQVNPFSLPSNTGAPDATAEYTAADGGLDVSIWKPHATLDRPVPVAFFVHGGGWISGAATDNGGHKRWLADRGWLVVSVDYTLSSVDKHLWASTLDQVGCAMSWTAAHAGDYGGDATRFVLLGDSAGGNLAVNAAYRGAAGSLVSSCGGQLPTVAAVAVNYPAVDVAGFHDNSDLLLGGLARQMTEQYTGGTPEEYPERYRATSSDAYITAAAPPTLIIVGDHDHLVPPAGAYEFTALARAAGVDVSLVRVPFGEHVFDANAMGSQLYRDITLSWLRQQLPGT